MIKILAFVAVALVAFTGCQENEDDTENSSVDETASVLSVPGVIRLPVTDGFVEMKENEHDAILLYCWLPTGNYPASEKDLEFLATIQERGITPVPVQFSSAVRNASQTQLNTLGISISVALGDDDLKDFFVTNNLPVAALVKADGSVVKASGFGCIERTLRGIQ